MTHYKIEDEAILTRRIEQTFAIIDEIGGKLALNTPPLHAVYITNLISILLTHVAESYGTELYIATIQNSISMASKACGVSEADLQAMLDEIVPTYRLEEEPKLKS